MGGGVAVLTGCSRDVQAEGWRAKRAYRRDRPKSPESRRILKSKTFNHKGHEGTQRRSGKAKPQHGLTRTDTDWNGEVEGKTSPLINVDDNDRK
jgi:hypothetical protein